jgi:hypothetical protein
MTLMLSTSPETALLLPAVARRVTMSVFGQINKLYQRVGAGYKVRVWDSHYFTPNHSPRRQAMDLNLVERILSCQLSFRSAARIASQSRWTGSAANRGAASFETVISPGGSLSWNGQQSAPL